MAASTPIISIIFFIIAALLGAVGQFLYKTGADSADGGILTFLVSGRILLGAICYIGVMILFVAAFKKGGAMTVLYPVYASTFIWSALIAWIAFGVPIRPVNFLGMLLMAAGMFLLGHKV